MLGEEVGELFKAVRKEIGVSVATDSQIKKVSEELADVFFLTMSIANRLGIDLEQVFRKKEEKNNQRSWGK